MSTTALPGVRQSLIKVGVVPVREVVETPFRVRTITPVKSPREFAVEASADDERTTRLCVYGEVDLMTAPAVAEALRTQMRTDHDVLLDLGHVEFIDSTGVVVVIEAINDAKVNGWNLGVAAKLSPAVNRVFELSGLLPLLPLVDN
jgi:anti-anti-sigma factor